MEIAKSNKIAKEFRRKKKKKANALRFMFLCFESCD